MMNKLFLKLTKFYGLNQDEYELVAIQFDLIKIKNKETSKEICLRY